MRTRTLASLRPCLLPCVAIAATGILTQPISVAIANWAEISLDAAAFGRHLALPFAGLSIGLVATSALLTRWVPTRWLALLAAFALALAVQGRLFTWNYGAFDGTPIDWSAHRIEAVVEAALWIGLLAFALARPVHLSRHAQTIALLVLATELGAVATTFVEHHPLPAREWEAAQVEDSENSSAAKLTRITQLSRQSNVLVIVLDMFQSDFFSEAIADPELARRMPPGFTYYRNAVSLYPTTRISLQSTLTSRQLDLERGLAQWQKEQMPTAIPALLVEQGYQASLLSISPQHLSCYFVRFGYGCYTPESLLRLSDAPTERSLDELQQADDVRQMLGLALFRLSPHFLKPHVHDGIQWQLPPLRPRGAGAPGGDPRIDIHSRRDLAIFELLTREARAIDTPPTFRFLHFQAAHYPNTLDASCAYNGQIAKVFAHLYQKPERRRRSAVAAASCSLSRLFDFLHRLDEIGVYDSSLVFVVGDHGNPAVDIAPAVAAPPLPPPPPNRSRSAARAPENLGRGVPLFLVKRRGERHPLRSNDRPVSLCDIPASIAAELRVEADFQCESIFDSNSDRRTPRVHHRYAEGSGKASPPYQFDVYSVDGHSWYPESWVPQGRAETPSRP